MCIRDRLYTEILSYLLPKHLAAEPEIKKYNKVMKSIPGIVVPSSNPRRIFSSARKSFQTVRYIYKIKRTWKNKSPDSASSMERNTVIVFVPVTISAARRKTLSLSLGPHQNEYAMYFNQSHSQGRAKIVDIQNKQFLKKAKYGWANTT